jgi:hypothetical protein
VHHVVVHHVVVMHHHVVVHHVVMMHHMVVHHVVVHAGERRNRDHREGQGDDSGGEGLDQVKLHYVFDPDLHRTRNLT